MKKLLLLLAVTGAFTFALPASAQDKAAPATPAAAAQPAGSPAALQAPVAPVAEAAA